MSRSSSALLTKRFGTSVDIALRASLLTFSCSLSRSPPNDPLRDCVDGFDILELFELLPVDKVPIMPCISEIGFDLCHRLSLC